MGQDLTWFPFPLYLACPGSTTLPLCEQHPRLPVLTLRADKNFILPRIPTPSFAFTFIALLCALPGLLPSPAPVGVVVLSILDRTAYAPYWDIVVVLYPTIYLRLCLYLTGVLVNVPLLPFTLPVVPRLYVYFTLPAYPGSHPTWRGPITPYLGGRDGCCLT